MTRTGIRIMNQLRGKGWMSGTYLSLLVADSEQDAADAFAELVRRGLVEERDGYYRRIHAAQRDGGRRANRSGGAPDEHGGNDDETHLVDGAPGGDAAGAGDCGDGAGALPRGGVPNG